MRKSLLALAALSAFAGGASAQSSVTLFGIVDAGYARLSAGGRSATGITNSGLNSSRLGFRGVEDLGGGLKAGFWIEGQLFNDVGQGVNATTGYNFQRRSTVSLLGDSWGEIRIGRDYSPNFWNTTVFDPFGTNGIGQSMTPSMLAGAGQTGPNSFNGVRADNSIAYHLPSLGGLYGQVTIAFGEQLSNAANKDQNDYVGGRIGYAAGPLNVAVAYGKTDGATGASDLKYTNMGASYAFGAFQPVFFWGTEKGGNGAKINAWLLGLNVTMGQGLIRVAYSDYDLKSSNNDWTKLAVGYIYNLSKRTAMYATYARVANDGAQVRAVGNNGLSAGNASPGGNSTGYEFGLRHSF